MRVLPIEEFLLYNHSFGGKMRKKKLLKKTILTKKKGVKRRVIVEDKTIESIIKAAVGKVLDNTRQNLVGRLNDEARPLLTQFSESLQQRLMEQCRVWASKNTEEDVPCLPDNVKFYTKVGSRAVIVLEYKPQVRTLFMINALMNSCPQRGDPAATCQTGRAQQAVTVSLPYVILTLAFDANRFAGLYLNHRNAPLESLKDMLCYSNLPNVSSSLDANQVCMGQIFGENELNSMSRYPIAKQVDRVASTFWQSVFNVDYTDYYKEVAQRVPKMQTLLDWHNSSLADPLFILKVAWKQHVTLGMLIQQLTSHAAVKTGLGQVFQQEMEKALATIADSLQKLLQNSKEVVKIDPQLIDRTVTTSFANAIADKVNKALLEQKQKEQERKTREKQNWSEDGYPSWADDDRNTWKRSW